MSSQIVAVFSGFRNEHLKKMIEEIYGRVSSSISKYTTHLIVKDMLKAGKKIEEAKDNGIIVMTLDEFLTHYHMRLPEKIKIKKTAITKKNENSSSSDEQPENESPEKNTKIKTLKTLKTKKYTNEIIESQDEEEEDEIAIDVTQKKIVKSKKIINNTQTPNKDVSELKTEIEIIKSQMSNLHEKMMSLEIAISKLS